MSEQQLAALGLQPVTIDIIQRCNDFFGIADPDGRALFVNEAGRRIYGLKPDESIAHLSMLDFVAKSDQQRFLEEVVQTAYSTDKVRGEIHAANFSTSEVFLIEFSFFLRRDDQGEPVGFMAFGTDMRMAQELRDLLEIVQNTLQVGSWQLDIETGRTIWSDKVYEIYKLPKGTPVDKIDGISFYAPHERGRISCCVESCASAGTPYDEEFEFIDAEGTRLWIRAIGYPVRSEDGTIIGQRGTFQDITARKSLELENQQTSLALETFKAVVDNSPDFIGIANTENQPVYLNPAGRAMLGIPLERPIESIRVEDYYPAGTLEQTMAPIFEGLREEGRYRGETRFRHFETDAQIPVLTSHFLINDSKSGRWLGHATISRDISEENRLRASLEDERAKLAHAAKLASLGELSAGVAHEINNPLSVISGANELIGRAGGDADKIRRHTERIEKSVRRIGIIVNGLKKFSRTSGELDLVPVDMNALLRECIALIEPKAKRAGHAISLIAPASPVICRADEIQIEQVIINLLVNAIDANAGTAAPWTEITLAESENFCIVEVRDSGAGIDADVLEHMFDPFFTTKDVGQGTGLGLSISSGIVADHGGTLTYCLTDGHTSFRVSLPRERTP